MMRDIFGRPVGPRPTRGPWAERRVPSRPQPPRTPVGLRHEHDAAPHATEAPRSAEDAPAPRRPVDSSARPTGVAAASEQLAKAHAELEATRGRLTREATREREAEKLRLAGQLLPVLDDFDRSIAAARRDVDVQPPLVEGFELVRARLERVLEGYGLERIPALGERFDPAVHDALGVVEVDDPRDAGKVVDEVERGYRAGDRVVRPARVRVGVAA